QDYEPWFLPEDDTIGRRRVEATYRRIDRVIVKSRWLQGMLELLGCRPERIPLGLDLSIFYPRDTARLGQRVVAMARPTTPRRGFPTLVEALRRVHAARPDVEFILFGDNQLDPDALPFPCRVLGVVTDMDALATLYSSAAVFIDSSDFQGFGRC